MHTESAIECNAVLIGNVDDARSLAVNLNFLFSVTAALVGSVIAQLEDIPHGLRRFFVDQPLVLVFGLLNESEWRIGRQVLSGFPMTDKPCSLHIRSDTSRSFLCSDLE